MIFAQNPWIILALPLFSFVFIGLILRPFTKKLSAAWGTVSLFGALMGSLTLAGTYFSGELGPVGAPHILWSFEWLRFQKNLDIHFGILIDSISVMMLVVVTSISFLVHLYSSSYMSQDPGYGRFYTYLSLFTFSMLGLVVSPNLFQMYVFWELVGVSSFLLIGFYYEKPSAVSAAKKAFIVTRFADLGFLIGILLLGYLGAQVHQTLGTSSLALGSEQALNFSFLTQPTVITALTQTGFLGLALTLIYIGAAGKSAMFPLHIWLPDAMEGPTPVSALIHAATMVVAGVYLVARLFPTFSAVPDTLQMISWIGLVTSAFAAVIACTQNDIKRVLAFSTLSQLGYMMFSLGVADLQHSLGYTASMFHLFTHAFFKALLFLGAGAMIHAVHTNNIWHMGGLRKKMPITHACFAIAVLAISGIWPLAGFFSKDEILAAALDQEKYFHFFGGLLVAGLTAYYMARIYFLSFWGQARSTHVDHAHETPVLMWIPLVILAVLSISAGWIPFGHFINLENYIGGIDPTPHAMNLAVAVLGTSAALIGLFTSWLFYGRNDFQQIKNLAHRFSKTHELIKNKFYFDELYLYLTHKVIFRFVAGPIAWFDRHVVDRSVDLAGEGAQGSSLILTKLQTGHLQTYGVWFVLGSCVALVCYILAQVI